MKIMVVSHERSGTHLLIDSIATNFRRYESAADKRCDLDSPVMYCDPQVMEFALRYSPRGELVHDRDIAGIWKSHHPWDLFEPVSDYLFSQYRVLCIARDGRDVLTSLWRHAWYAPWQFFPRKHSVGVFMQEYPCGYMCERYNRADTPNNFVQRWNDHVVSWMDDLKSRVLYLTYEELKGNYEAAIARIGRHIEETPNSNIQMPPLGGVTPWKGISGNWKNYFDDDDSAFFWHFGESAMNILGMDDGRSDREFGTLHEPAATIPW